VALPVAMDATPFVFALQQGHGPTVLASSIAVVGAETVIPDMMGDDLLADRQLAAGEQDRRSVGDAYARHLETADLLAVCGTADARSRALLDHLVGGATLRHDLQDLDSAVFHRRRPREWANLGDLRGAAPTGTPDTAGVWTLDLSTWKPLHPFRLQQELEGLGAGALRGRGYFWLPTRPQMQCAWDGAGGQLSIGELDRWSGPPRTRLVITGVDNDRRYVRRAFARAVMTDAELAGGLARWQNRDDGLDLWLGPREDDCGSVAALLAEDD
jgi:G3E family GTPase